MARMVSARAQGDSFSSCPGQHSTGRYRRRCRWSDMRCGFGIAARSSKINAVAAKPSAFYVNVHNGKHLAGAMRGQLKADL